MRRTPEKSIACLMIVTLLFLAPGIAGSVNADGAAALGQSMPGISRPSPETLANALSQMVAAQEMTAAQKEALLAYLKPLRGTQTDPLAGAVSQGMITAAQAQLLKQRLSTAAASPTASDGASSQQQAASLPAGEGTHLSLSDAKALVSTLGECVLRQPAAGGYPIVDTGQTTAYSTSGPIDPPKAGSAYFGQDATYAGRAPSYTDNGDGTITDNVTGLMWQKDPGDKMLWSDAVKGSSSFSLAGYDDWRLPTVKELYSLMQFTGTTGVGTGTSIPYLDTRYFVFKYGDVTGERAIDSQYLSTTLYESTTMNGNVTMFGVNFADGRIKGYPLNSKKFYVLHVRGNTHYGLNQFVDNGDGTVTDLATGLMWMEYDSGHLKAGDLKDGTLSWEQALNWAEGLSYAGHSDWRLPDAKELQSLVDYTRSPDTTGSAAISPLFQSTVISGSGNTSRYGYYWTGTTHLDGLQPAANAVYVAFGEALGQMNGTVMDVHGAGAQRSDPKAGSRSEYPQLGKGPQGDERVVYNLARVCRTAD